MASKTPMRLLTTCRPLAGSMARAPRWGSSTRCTYSTESSPSAPPLLAKLKGDLKMAMKAKDAPRLAVLRSVLAATLNASKTGSPIATDAQLVALMIKTARTGKESTVEFREAGRQDLVDKEEAQIRVIEEYVAGSGIESIDDAKLREAVQLVLSELLAGGEKPRSTGLIMKKLLAPDGPLAGKMFDKAALGKITKELLDSA
ncbi:Yqey-like protein-domain-containing protein [Podospora conica]|nr:Yqey-like protein-domain-containing protein [Schizothecium conicum]